MGYGKSDNQEDNRGSEETGREQVEQQQKVITFADYEQLMEKLEKSKNYEEIKQKNPKVVQDKNYTREMEIESALVKKMLEKKL